MSINFDNLSYCSLYGSTRVVRRLDNNDEVSSGSITLSGVLGAGASTSYLMNFEYGIPYDPAVPGDPDEYGITDSTAIPYPSVAAYVNSGLAPNDSTRWFLVGSNPRPLTVPSSAGNLNMNVYSFQNVSTSAAPTTFWIKFDIFNPYGVAATITSNTISCLIYGFSSS